MKFEIRRLAPPPVPPGQFSFAVTGLAHAHINSMTAALIDAGAELKLIWDSDSQKLADFAARFPGAKLARCEDEILEASNINLVAAAAVPSERCELGIRVMNSGKDYFTDKAPLTSLSQLEAAKKACGKTGKRYFCYFGERLRSESGIYAGELVKNGAIGRVVQVLGLGPHRLAAESRPDWFFEKSKYGGIIIDIGSHQAEQFLYYTGARDARILSGITANYANPAYPELEDFGSFTLLGDNGANGYFRVDWLTPDGLGSWGDGRVIILGTNGYIELRKNLNIAAQREGDHVFLVNESGEYHIQPRGKVGYPFFGEMIQDCLNRTERAMTQEHIFKAAELSILAQIKADEGMKNNCEKN